MNLDNYEKTLDKTFNTVNTVYSAGRRIGYVLMGLFFMLISFILIGWGIYSYKDKTENFATYKKTEGTVIRLREVPETENTGITYAPVIKYKDASGKEYTYESKHSSDPPDFNVGEKVQLIYDPADPEEVYVDSFREKWVLTIVLFLCGLIVFPISIWMIFTGFRRNKPSKNINSGPAGSSSSYVSIG
jgi:hypothetical protein